jgi:hypothetical protein
MAYGFVIDVPAPIEFYDALHTEVGRRTPNGVEGLLLHLGRQTQGGFQVLEVWESKEQCDRFNAEVFGPVLAQLTEGQPQPPSPPMQEFEPRGLIIPSADVMV